MTFAVKARYAASIRWSLRGSCGQSGCKDPECCCSVCHQPIGVSEDDPRWEEHPEYCTDCEVCRDQAPFQIFRGAGKKMEQASFCTACFKKVIHFR